MLVRLRWTKSALHSLAEVVANILQHVVVIRDVQMHAIGLLVRRNRPADPASPRTPESEGHSMRKHHYTEQASILQRIATIIDLLRPSQSRREYGVEQAEATAGGVMGRTRVG